MDVKVSFFLYFVLIEFGLCNVIFEPKLSTVDPIDVVKVEPLLHGHVQIKKRQPRSPQYTDGQVAEISAANGYGIDPTETFANSGVESSTVQAEPQTSNVNVNPQPQYNNMRPSSTINYRPTFDQYQATNGYRPFANNFNQRNPIRQSVENIASQGNIYFPSPDNPFLNTGTSYRVSA